MRAEGACLQVCIKRIVKPKFPPDKPFTVSHLKAPAAATAMGQTLTRVSDTAPLPRERQRLLHADDPNSPGGFGKGTEKWRKWGSYTADRQWGTVREDYSRDGEAWSFFTHDDARSRAYRWGEDALLGFSDDMQLLNFSLAMWNQKDDIVKERLYGLTNDEGPHGEDCKEVYYFEDAIPTASYMRAMYRYTMHKYPYGELVRRNMENKRRLWDRQEYVSEVELEDTGVLNDDNFWDVSVEYAKSSPDDVSIRISVENCAAHENTIVLMPSLYYRNTWSWEEGAHKPTMRLEPSLAPSSSSAAVVCEGTRDGNDEIEEMALFVDGLEDSARQTLFCDNQTRIERFEGRSICRNLYKNPETNSAFPKDCINNCVVSGKHFGGPNATDDNGCNPEKKGTKMSSTHVLTVPAGETRTVVLRLLPSRMAQDVRKQGNVFDEAVFTARKAEADEFYQWINPGEMTPDRRNIHRQALAGMLWTRQTMLYDVGEWLRAGPEERLRDSSRNRDWSHLVLKDVMSVCDGWEYPWHASWDLAFHLILFAHVDPAFAKEQSLLLFRPGIVHPTGSIPAYEWGFEDFSPPLAAWAAWKIFETEQSLYGISDREFLRRSLPGLNRFYTWFLNQADHRVIGGSFLGLDNISPVNRSKIHEYEDLEAIYQVDGTAWAAVMSLAMVRISLELEMEEFAAQAFTNFVFRSQAINNFDGALPRPGFERPHLYDEEMEWYCDVVRFKDGSLRSTKGRTVVGLIPLFATECLKDLDFLCGKYPLFFETISKFIESSQRSKFTEKVINMNSSELHRAVDPDRAPSPKDDLGLFIVDEARLRAILKYVLDPAHFLSEYGIRSVSKDLERNPVYFDCGKGVGVKELKYLPRESYGDAKMFGGNSSWRGSQWFCITYFLISSLLQYHEILTPSFTVECPTGSGVQMTLKEVALELSRRFVKTFETDSTGSRPLYGDRNSFYNKNPRFSSRPLFYEYFDGDRGTGIGASHQTGWTGLVADLIARIAHAESQQ